VSTFAMRKKSFSRFSSGTSRAQPAFFREARVQHIQLEGFARKLEIAVAAGSVDRPGMLPASRFGGPESTKTMIHVTWHLTTIAFLTVGSALLLSGSVLQGDQARGIGLVAASAATGFAAVTVGLSAAHAQSLRSLLRHPGPAVLTATAVLAWWGAL